MERRRSSWGFLAPFLLLFVAFLVGPLCYAFYISLFTRSMGTLNFVGLRNYIIVFQYAPFWTAVVRVLYFGVVQTTFMLVLSLVLALLIDTPFARGKSFFRLIYFIPYAVPGVFSAIMWGFLLYPTFNPILNAIRINPLSPGLLLYSLMNIATWVWTGYNMTLYTASLSGVSAELYDAARIDGAGEWSVMYYIKLPLLRPTIAMTATLSMIGAIQLFNEPFILSALTTVPITFTPNMTVYTMAFQMINLPFAAALAVVLGLITIAASGLVVGVRSIVRLYTEPGARKWQTASS